MAYPVPQPDPTSVVGRRVLAVLIDALIVLIPAFLVATSEFEYYDVDTLGVSGEAYCDEYLDEVGGFCFNMDDRVYFSDGAGGGAGTPLYWGLNFGLLVLLQAFTGWTPGKLIAGIRVVREDGGPPGLAKALVRWVLWIVDGFPYFIPGLVGFITALTTPGHRRVGDMAAKTFVVRRAAAGAPVILPGQAMPVAAAPWGSAVPTPGPPSTTSWVPADPSAAGWASPGASPAPTPPAAPVAPAPTPSTEGPQWDEARGTYIQWDPAQQAWMQWDEGFKAWTRIPGQ